MIGVFFLILFWVTWKKANLMEKWNSLICNPYRQTCLRVSKSKVKLIAKRFDCSNTLRDISSFVHPMDLCWDISYFVSDGVVAHNITACISVAYRGEGGLRVQTPPPKLRRPSKIMPNSTRLWKLLKIAEFRTPTLQDVRKKGSKILKLPRFAIVLH